MTRYSFWTQEKTDQLRGLWDSTKTAAQIATDIGGVSRSAVLGKAHRLKLDPKAPSNDDQAVIEARKKRKTSTDVHSKRIRRGTVNPRAPEIVEPVSPIASLKLSFDEIGRFQCRWIGNEDMTAPEYCGHATVEGKSWCAFHAQAMRATTLTPQEIERRRQRGRDLARANAGSRRPFGFEFVSAAMPVE